MDSSNAWNNQWVDDEVRSCTIRVISNVLSPLLHQDMVCLSDTPLVDIYRERTTEYVSKKKGQWMQLETMCRDYPNEYDRIRDVITRFLEGSGLDQAMDKLPSIPRNCRNAGAQRVSEMTGECIHNSKVFNQSSGIVQCVKEMLTKPVGLADDAEGLIALELAQKVPGRQIATNVSNATDTQVIEKQGEEHVRDPLHNEIVKAMWAAFTMNSSHVLLKGCAIHVMSKVLTPLLRDDMVCLSDTPLAQIYSARARRDIQYTWQFNRTYFVDMSHDYAGCRFLLNGEKKILLNRWDGVFKALWKFLGGPGFDQFMDKFPGIPRNCRNAGEERVREVTGVCFRNMTDLSQSSEVVQCVKDMLTKPVWLSGDDRRSIVNQIANVSNAIEAQAFDEHVPEEGKLRQIQRGVPDLNLAKPANASNAGYNVTRKPLSKRSTKKRAVHFSEPVVSRSSEVREAGDSSLK